MKNERTEREQQLKQQVKHEIFNNSKNYVVDVECFEHDKGAKYDGESGKYFRAKFYKSKEDIPEQHKSRARQVNISIERAIREQINRYYSILEPDDTRGYCNKIILIAINKFRLPEDARQGEEKSLIYAYVLKTLDRQIQNYIREETGAIEDKSGGTRDIITPCQMIRYDAKDKIYFNETIKDRLKNNQNLFDSQAEHEPTEAYKQILKLIDDRLTEYQKEILNILAYTVDGANLNGNIAEVGRILKEKDIEEGNKLRPSKEAYRVHTSRQIKRIIKVINENVNDNKINNIHKVSRLTAVKDEIKELLEEPTEKSIIAYCINNLDREYINNIIYSLDSDLRQHFIKNYVKTHDTSSFKGSKTRRVGIHIVSKLYEYMEQLQEEIESLGTINPIGRAILGQGYKKPVLEDSKIKYYVTKDKYDELRKSKDITRLGTEKIIVRYTRKYEPYREEKYDAYYLGEHEAEVRTVKQGHKSITQQGLVLDAEGNKVIIK